MVEAVEYNGFFEAIESTIDPLMVATQLNETGNCEQTNLDIDSQVLGGWKPCYRAVNN